METKTKNQLISLAFAASGIACAARLFTRDRVAEFGRLKTSGRSTNDRDIPVSDKEAMWRIAEEDFTLGLGCAGAAAGVVYYFQKAYGVEGSINGLALSGDELGGKFDDAVAAEVDRVQKAKKKAPERLRELFEDLLEEARKKGDEWASKARLEDPNWENSVNNASTLKKGAMIVKLNIYLRTQAAYDRSATRLLQEIYYSAARLAAIGTMVDRWQKAGIRDKANAANAFRVKLAKRWADDSVRFFRTFEKERGIF